MKTRFLTFAALVLAFTLFLNGCSQAPQPQNEIEEPAPQEGVMVNEELPIADDIPHDYEGVWLRTATYADGNLVSSTPATLTLNRTSYTSTGTCVNTGEVISGGAGGIRLTIASSSCPSLIKSGPGYDATYSMTFDKERDVEVMTIVTGNVMETYDRQS
ncbi:hypothetical protein ACFL3C_04985 [Patescibacteria group bacterium]